MKKAAILAAMFAVAFLAAAGVVAPNATETAAVEGPGPMMIIIAE